MEQAWIVLLAPGAPDFGALGYRTFMSSTSMGGQDLQALVCTRVRLEPGSAFADTQPEASDHTPSGEHLFLPMGMVIAAIQLPPDKPFPIGFVSGGRPAA